MAGTFRHEKEVFKVASLPSELQQLIFKEALGSGVSPTDLLCLSSQIHKDVLPLLYTHIQIRSLAHLLSLLYQYKAVGNHSSLYTRSFTLTIAGVPGGSTRGGRESVPSSPGKRPTAFHHLNDRLLLASKVLLLCPKLQHCTLEMFGVRHNSLLTSADYLTEETNTFRLAVSQLKHLESFSWITPKENDNFKGISIAVVDLTFDPLVEGLELAALDMGEDGRRIQPGLNSSPRYTHPLKNITLRHCIFPSDQGKRFFQLFTKRHPDDSQHILFSKVQLLNIKKAVNVDPINVAYLALFWQLQIDQASSIETDPCIILEDVYINSIYGSRLTPESIQQSFDVLIKTCMTSTEAILISSNEYIRSLEESVEIGTRLDADMCNQIQSLKAWQRDKVIDGARQRIKIGYIEGTVASYQ